MVKNDERKFCMIFIAVLLLSRFALVNKRNVRWVIWCFKECVRQFCRLSFRKPCWKINFIIMSTKQLYMCWYSFFFLVKAFVWNFLTKLLCESISNKIIYVTWRSLVRSHQLRSKFPTCKINVCLHTKRRKMRNLKFHIAILFLNT